jgi:hypothetical protein
MCFLTFLLSYTVQIYMLFTFFLFDLQMKVYFYFYDLKRCFTNKNIIFEVCVLKKMWSSKFLEIFWTLVILLFCACWVFSVLNIEKDCYWKLLSTTILVCCLTVMLMQFTKFHCTLRWADDVFPLPRQLAPFRRSTTLDHLSCWAKLHQFRHYHLLYWAPLWTTI